MLPEQYHASDLALWLHAFPHVDLTFTLTNDTFDPENYNYRETLYFLAALPVIWMILTLLVLSIYMCCRCCWFVTKTTKECKRRQKTCCLNWAVFLLLVISGILLGLSYFGNEQADDGVRRVVSALQKVNSTVDEVSKRVGIFDKTINRLESIEITNIYEVITEHVPNATIKAQILNILSHARDKCTFTINRINSIRTTAHSIHIDKVGETIATVEFYRWMGTIIILCLILFICIIFFIGVVRKSKMVLICAITVSTACLVLGYALSGLYLGTSVATGDFCVDPDTFILSMTTHQIQPIMESYLSCYKDPYSDDVNAVTTTLTDVNRTINQVLDIVQPFHIKSKIPLASVRQQISDSISNMSRIGALVSCTNLHTDYMDALYALCDTALLGVVFMMLSVFVLGLTITIMICLASVIWRHYGISKKRYDSDDSDPFLPRPPPYNGYGAIPTECVASVHDTNSRVDVRLSNRSSVDMTAGASYHPAESPPPAYNHRSRQYEVSHRQPSAHIPHKYVNEPGAIWHEQKIIGYDPNTSHGMFLQ